MKLSKKEKENRGTLEDSNSGGRILLKSRSFPSRRSSGAREEREGGEGGSLKKTVGPEAEGGGEGGGVNIVSWPCIRRALSRL